MKKTITIGLVLIFIALAGLFIIKYVNLPIGKYKPPATQPQESTAPPLEKPKITLPKVLYNLAGSIQEIAKDSLLFEAAVPYLDKNNEAAIKNEVRKALITATTKFSSLTFVEKPGSKSRVPQETAISLKDLKKGDYVEVVSNQDISQAQVFEATLIRILQKSF